MRQTTTSYQVQLMKICYKYNIKNGNTSLNELFFKVVFHCCADYVDLQKGVRWKITHKKYLENPWKMEMFQHNRDAPPLEGTSPYALPSLKSAPPLKELLGNQKGNVFLCDLPHLWIAVVCFCSLSGQTAASQAVNCIDKYKAACHTHSYDNQWRMHHSRVMRTRV